MKNKFLLTLTVISLIIFALFSVSCGGDEEKFTGIQTPNLAYKDGAYVLSVSSDVTNFDLSSIFSISEKASYVVSQNESFSTTVSEEIELSYGSNKYYVKVADVNGNVAIYKFIITKKSTFNVTFNVNGGTQVATIQCEDGQIIEAPVSLKPGYTLSWDYDFLQPITKDITITATWVANEYKITVADTDNVINVKYGDSYEINAPQKAGYKFIGWLNNGVSFDASLPYNVEGDIVLTPTYEIQQYTINYITFGGVNDNPAVYTVEDEMLLKSLTWQSNGAETVTYEFGGWYKDAAYTVPVEKIEKGTTGNLDLYGKWIITDIPDEKIQTTVTILAPGFDCNEKTEVFTAGEEYSLPALAKEGYNFAGWQSENGNIPLQLNGVWALTEEELTIVPIWLERTYSITYSLNGGVNDENNVNSYTVTKEIELLNPTKLYSEFDGWYTDSDYTVRIDKISEGTVGDIVLYAKWNEISYTVSYDANLGEVSQLTQNIPLGSNYSLLTPVRNGYTFDGWFEEGAEEAFVAQGQWLFEKNVSLVAKWTIIKYTINYELNDGVVSGLINEYDIDTNTFVLPKPTKEGQLFLGWSLNGEGAVERNVVITKGSVGNRTYVANWCDEKDSSGFLYTISNDEAMVVGYQGKTGANVTIPADFNGYKVTAIANDAFNGYGQKLANLNSGGFTTFLIPNTITRIGSNAFNDCADLKVLLYNSLKDKDNNSATEEEIAVWEQSLVVEDGNKHVIDVIKGIRPAIGWKVYTK